MPRHRSRRPKLEPVHDDRRALAYVRVSSEAQTEFSPDAQRSSVEQYAKRAELDVVGWYQEARSAKSAGGRPQFASLVKSLKSPGAPKVAIFDKADRSARNLRDYADLDDLLRSHGVALHFVRDGLVVAERGHRGSRLAWGFLMQLAKDYSENLSEEVMKGMGAKAARGLWPGGPPPRGYRIGADSILEPLPEVAPVVRELFLEAARGASLSVLSRLSRERGQPVSRAQVGWILRSPVYRGDLAFAGRVHPGRHTALVTREEWTAAQVALDGRRIGGRRPKGGGRYHELAGLVRCAACGCQLTGATKKGGAWVAYRCTGRRGGGKPCGPYVREAVLLGAIGAALDGLTLDGALADAVAKEIHASHAEDSAFRAREEARLSRLRAALQARLDRAYEDAADGTLSRADHARLAAKWRAELDRAGLELATLDGVTAEARDRALAALDLARNVGRLWRVAAPGESRRAVLVSVARGLEWTGDSLRLELAQPFDGVTLAADSSGARPGWWGSPDNVGTAKAIADGLLRWARAA